MRGRGHAGEQCPRPTPPPGHASGTRQVNRAGQTLATNVPLAAAFLRPLLEVAQTTARRLRIDTDPVVADLDGQLGTGLDGQHHLLRSAVPDGVAATACAPTSRGTSVSTAPEIRTVGAIPDPTAASAAVSRSLRRSPPASASPAVCRSKIAVRISRTVVSRSSTACWIRACVGPSPVRRSVLCSDNPVATAA